MDAENLWESRESTTDFTMVVHHVPEGENYVGG